VVRRPSFGVLHERRRCSRCASLFPIAAVAFVPGAGLMVFNSLWETTLQRQIPDAALSRVSAYDWFGSLLMQPLGFAIVGPALVLFGQTRWLWIAFAGQLLSCLLMFVPASVRRLTADEAPTVPAERSPLTENVNVVP